MRIGFTGTRNGMTPAQKATVIKLIEEFKISEAHEGDCIGSDAEFYDLVDSRLPPDKIVVHPPIANDLRAFKIKPGNIVRPPKGYFNRNRDIADESDVVIGTPPAMVELKSGGTWYTLNYKRKHHGFYVVVWPDGTELRGNEAICGD